MIARPTVWPMPPAVGVPVVMGGPHVTKRPDDLVETAGPRHSDAFLSVRPMKPGQDRRGCRTRKLRIFMHQWMILPERKPISSNIRRFRGTNNLDPFQSRSKIANRTLHGGVGEGGGEGGGGGGGGGGWLGGLFFVGFFWLGGVWGGGGGGFGFGVWGGCSHPQNPSFFWPFLLIPISPGSAFLLARVLSSLTCFFWLLLRFRTNDRQCELNCSSETRA